MEKRDRDERTDAELCDAVREGIGLSASAQSGRMANVRVIEEARYALVILEDRLGVRREDA